MAVARRRLTLTVACLALLALATLLGAGASAASAAEPCPNEALRAEDNSLTLPDCRAYELVSGLGTANIGVYVPNLSVHDDAVVTRRPFQASTDGDAVTYAGDSSATGNGNEGPGGGNQYLATRAPTGWTAQDIMPPGTVSPVYQAFSSDLSLAVLESSDSPPLAPTAPGGGYDILYARPGAYASYTPLFTAFPPTRAAGEFGTAHLGASLEPTTYAGSSADQRQFLFEANDALTDSAKVRPPTKEQNDLYDYHEGGLSLVNILPDGTPEPGASFGGPPPPEKVGLSDFSHVISADGSLVFWTDQGTGRIYLRQNPAGSEECTLPGEPAKACTVPVSLGAARYWTATPDGRYVYYTENGELWRFDSLAGDRTVLAGPGAEVQGVIGVNESGEDGAYVYFVADGVLAANANANHEEAVAGKPNLYLSRNGATVFIATLAPQDDAIGFLSGSGTGTFGDWQPGLGERTATLTPSGHDLLFLSQQMLTAYENAGMTEVYRYDADAAPSAALLCPSCGPEGAPPPVGGLNAPTPGAAAYLTAGLGATYLPRSVSDDGSRVFFDSQEPLVSADSNALQDVYEWEAPGAGSCRQSSQAFSAASGGCLYLLSGGTGADSSYFLDAGASGSDAFLITRDRLLPQDHGEEFDVYDVRSEGGFPESPQSQSCGGEACRPSLREPLGEAGPSTDTLHETEPPPPPGCQRGFIRRHHRCTKKRQRKHRHGRSHRRGDAPAGRG